MVREGSRRFSCAETRLALAVSVASAEISFPLGKESFKQPSGPSPPYSHHYYRGLRALGAHFGLNEQGFKFAHVYFKSSEQLWIDRRAGAGIQKVSKYGQENVWINNIWPRVVCFPWVSQLPLWRNLSPFWPFSDFLSNVSTNGCCCPSVSLSGGRQPGNPTKQEGVEDAGSGCAWPQFPTLET